MCGRYDLSESPAAIRAKFEVPDVPHFAGGGDLRPTQRLPIVRLDGAGARECTLARWGLVPHWAQDLSFGSRCFNARSETAARAPAFRAAYAQRRCLVPLNAFHEWSGPQGQRTRHRIHPDGEPLFALAGLWERWGRGADSVDTYTVLTCPPNEAMAPIHDRMPVILAPADYETWLREPAAALLQPYAGRLVIESLAPPARVARPAPARQAEAQESEEAPAPAQQRLF
jgi:putative SOS response-associated peptidase YedK